MTILVTGGFGFIGSNFINRYMMLNPDEEVLVMDNMSYASNISNLIEPIKTGRLNHAFCDIADAEKVKEYLTKYKPKFIVHFAAESHVDNSIRDCTPFLHSNVFGTVNLLEQVRNFCPESLFLHVSTDEVFGSLNIDDKPFTEKTPYAPRSPYAASKAASDHFVRAYSVTHGLKTIITNCSNNFGPYQHPEKLIPTIIRKALADERVPIYGNGLNIRDWLYVEDHVDALMQIMERGRIGEQYCIGGGTQKTNMNLAIRILNLLGKPVNLIQLVEDRKGHDFRYDIDSDKLFLDVGWKPSTSFDRGLEKTVKWYQNNIEWVKSCKLSA